MNLDTTSSVFRPTPDLLHLIPQLSRALWKEDGRIVPAEKYRNTEKPVSRRGILDNTIILMDGFFRDFLPHKPMQTT